MSAARYGTHVIYIPGGHGKLWRIGYYWTPGEPGSPPHARIEDAVPPEPGTIGRIDMILESPGNYPSDMTAALEALGFDFSAIEETIRGKEGARV